MSERTVVTRRYDFVKKVENKFVMQYCFDSFYENLQFLQNQLEIEAESAVSNCQKFSIITLITNSALLTGRHRICVIEATCPPCRARLVLVRLRFRRRLSMLAVARPQRSHGPKVFL